MLRNTAIRLNNLGRRWYQVSDHTKKVIPIYPPVESPVTPKNGVLLKNLSKIELDTKLDPTEWRRKLISKHNSECVKAGDVVRVVYDKEKCSYETFVGYVLSLDRKELVQDASLLLRNQISKSVVEVRLPVFSPLIKRIDILKKGDGSRKRNKHYYIRGTKLDVRNLESKTRRK